MQPFRVICETCRSRLKVSSAEAIGQIHACPKCGSMVQIAPPADWKAEAVAPVAAALSAAAIEPVLTLSTSASTIVPADFGIDLSTASTVNVVPSQVTVAPPAALPVEVASGLSPLFWCAIGGAALFVVAGLTFVLWPSGDKHSGTTPVAAAIVSPQPSAINEREAKSSTSVDRQLTTDDRTNVAPVVQTTAKPVEAATEPTAKTPPIDEPKSATTAAPPAVAAAPPAIPPASDPPVAAATPTATTEPKIAAGADAPPATTTANTSGTAPVLKIDPLDFDPERMSLSPGPANGATNLPVPATSSIPPQVPGASPAADVAVGEKSPAPADLLPPVEHKAINVRRGPMANDESRALDSAARLAMRLPSLQLAEMPLARFVETLSELSGVPITLDPIALEQNGMSARTAVSSAGANTTIDKILRDALNAQRLDLAEQDGHASVVLDNSDERRVVDFDVKDLANGADAAAIAKLIERFVAPASWKAAGGKGTIEVNGTTLRIEQSLGVRREGLIFCERLRLARGLALRSKYPRELLTVDSPYMNLAPKLNQPTTFTNLVWTPLSDVVQGWQDLLSLMVLVDWSALREAEFDPESPVACSAIDRPWAEALYGVLTPLGLAWWAVDGQTIQITTIDALERIERVEFYAVPKSLGEQFAANDNLMVALQKEIAERPNKIGKSGDVRMALDAASGRLIVRATPDVQRFLSGRLPAAK